MYIKYKKLLGVCLTMIDNSRKHTISHSLEADLCEVSQCVLVCVNVWVCLRQKNETAGRINRYMEALGYLQQLQEVSGGRKRKERAGTVIYKLIKY